MSLAAEEDEEVVELPGLPDLKWHNSDASSSSITEELMASAVLALAERNILRTFRKCCKTTNMFFGPQVDQ